MPAAGATAEIVDAQIHLWTEDSVTDARRAHRPGGFTAAAALREMDTAGVDIAVAIPTVWAGGRNDYCIASAVRYPDRLRVVARLPFDERTGLRDLADLSTMDVVVGIRLSFTGEAASLLADPSTEWIWPAAGEAGLPVMVFAPGLLTTLGLVAERHPGTRFVVDHAGIPSHTSPALSTAAVDATVALAHLSNVAVKVSAMPCASTEPYPFRDLDGYVEKVRRAYGARRMMWGSDLTRLPCPYQQAVRHFGRDDWLLSEQERRSVMCLTTRQWLRWS